MDLSVNNLLRPAVVWMRFRANYVEKSLKIGFSHFLINDGIIFVWCG